MAALTKDRNTPYCGDRDTLRIPVAAGATIYQGSMVVRDATGYARPASDIAGYRLAGISLGDLDNGTSTVDNSGGGAGALYVYVRRNRVHELVAAALTRADIGKRVYVADDQTVQLAPTNVFAGILVDLGDGESATIARVAIEPATWAEDIDEGMDALELPVAATQNIVSGNLVAYDGDGYLCNANDATAVRFAGVALEAANNAAGLDGAINCFVARAGRHNLTAAGLAAGDAGKPVYVGGAATVQLAPARMFVGILSKYSSAIVAPTDIEPGTQLTGDKERYGVAATKAITAGNLVALDADGYAVAANDATAVQFIGIAMDTQNNAAGADGALIVTVLRRGKVRATAAGLAATDAGKDLWISNATTVTTVPGRLRCGKLYEYTAATHGNLDIEPEVAPERFGVAANIVITAGDLLALDADGYAVDASDATAVSFLGIALDTQDNTGGADDALKVCAKRKGSIRMTAAGLTADDVGKPLYQVTDNVTVSITPGNIYCGKLEKYTAATHGNLQMDSATEEPFDIDGGGARGRLFTLSFCYPGLPGAGAVNVQTDLELPRKYRVLAGFANCITAPGGAVVSTIRLTDGVTNFDITITGAAVAGENKTPSVAMLANTDSDVTITEGGGGVSADYTITYVCEEL